MLSLYIAAQIMYLTLIQKEKDRFNETAEVCIVMYLVQAVRALKGPRGLNDSSKRA